MNVNASCRCNIVNELLLKMMADQIKAYCFALSAGGQSIDEINELLATKIVPQAEAWREMMLARVMNVLKDAPDIVCDLSADDAAQRTIN
jgi:hypothetical protein